MVGEVTLSQSAGGKDPLKNDPTTIKPNYMQRTSITGIKGIPRASTSGDQGDCTTESRRSPAIDVHTTNSGIQNRSI